MTDQNSFIINNMINAVPMKFVKPTKQHESNLFYIINYYKFHIYFIIKKKISTFWYY